jgi:hypothetical protein
LIQTVPIAREAMTRAYSERLTASGLTWRGEGAARWPAAV